MVIPAVSIEMLEGCIESIDKRFYKDILVVGNTSEISKLKVDCKAVCSLDEKGYFINLGVARSWNLGIDEVFTRNYDFLTIVSASMRFDKGFLDFNDKLEEVHERGELGLQTQDGWHCIALSSEIFEEIGLFDTNYYPGYFEDSDFIRRMELASIHEPCGDKHLPSFTVEGKSVKTAHAMKSGIRVNMSACGEYFVEKWGDYPSYSSQKDRDKLYKYPFNNPEFGLHYFEERSIGELKLAYGL